MYKINKLIKIEFFKLFIVIIVFTSKIYYFNSNLYSRIKIYSGKYQKFLIKIYIYL